MALTEQIDNYPGFEGGIDGFTLGEKMQKSAERFAQTALAEVYKASDGKFKLVETSEGVFLSRTVVIATGASPERWAWPARRNWWARAFTLRRLRRRVLSGQDRGRGGRRQFRRGGRPDLLPRCKKVYLVHRRDTLRATKIYHEPLERANVEFRWNSVVSALLSRTGLTGLRLRDVYTGAEHDLDCDGVFVSVGRQPATELFRRSTGAGRRRLYHRG